MTTKRVEDAVTALLQAFAKDFETEEHSETGDDESLIIMDENQEVYDIRLHLTYGHFRRLRAALTATEPETK